MSASWRCFVAATLDDSLRTALSDEVAAWRRQPPADELRWAEPDAWHLTLAFLGTVNTDDVPRLVTVIREVVAAHPPTQVATGRLGAFHRPGSARVLWYGASDVDGRLAALAGELSTALGVAADEAPFRPHVTLARARRRPIDLRGWIGAASAAAPEGRLVVDRIDLMRSVLGGGPARYETLETFTLGGAS